MNKRKPALIEASEISKKLNLFMKLLFLLSEARRYTPWIIFHMDHFSMIFGSFFLISFRIIRELDRLRYRDFSLSVNWKYFLGDYGLSCLCFLSQANGNGSETQTGGGKTAQAGRRRKNKKRKRRG